MVILQGRTYHKLDGKEIKIQHKTWTSLCWGKARMLLMIMQTIEGKGWYFSSRILTDILEELKMLMVITTFCCRGDPWRSNWSATASSKRTDATKDYWIHGYDTNRESSLLFEVNDMTRKIDVSLAHRRKWCSGNKDQVAQLKSAR